MKLLLLTIGLCMTNALVPNERIQGYADFKPDQINGRWYSIAVASKRPEMIMPGGRSRFQIYSFQVKKNGEIFTITYINQNDICQQINVTLTATKIPGRYKLTNLEDYFLIKDTDYKNFLIVYSQMENIGIWELFGRRSSMPKVYKAKFEALVMSRGLGKTDISYFSEMERCPKRVKKYLLQMACVNNCSNSQSEAESVDLNKGTNSLCEVDISQLSRSI
ncbi:lipocalin Can f 6.0101-like [Gracilinanus agilis]|uniref:lipocalin Can f 6.0101-like n=1 Tax=Gracilinanus agilis TaxID=191870 RepID=UPI001CFE5EAA|nr:lipocalin Can f 6.0101-like [Gracilinanus agilis]